MKKTLFVFLLGIPMILFALGNPDAGKIKSFSCVACHGDKGISINAQWPNLAGQHAGYILKQLQNFKEKSQRDNPMMWPFVQNLTMEDMADIAAFYASLPPPSPKALQIQARGEELYKAGDRKKNIVACIACHGPKAKGNPLANFPLLAGQKAEYTIAQMQAFKTAKRKNDLQGIMRDISAQMSQDDIESIAHYLEGL